MHFRAAIRATVPVDSARSRLESHREQRSLRANLHTLLRGIINREQKNGCSICHCLLLLDGVRDVVVVVMVVVPRKTFISRDSVAVRARARTVERGGIVDN